MERAKSELGTIGSERDKCARTGRTQIVEDEHGGPDGECTVSEIERHFLRYQFEVREEIFHKHICERVVSLDRDLLNPRIVERLC